MWGQGRFRNAAVGQRAVAAPTVLTTVPAQSGTIAWDEDDEHVRSWKIGGPQGPSIRL